MIHVLNIKDKIKNNKKNYKPKEICNKMIINKIKKINYKKKK